MAVDLEPLLHRLEVLAPCFGRARGEVELIVTRCRTGDFRGAMQNARLVLETLLRSLITDELKQTPGKAMLEELVAKFRQQAHAGLVPPFILAHMGTVQAWGNLSMHDHAGSLDDTAVRVGQDEVVASLNSMVAILTWYAERRGLLDEAATPPPALQPGRVVGGRYRLEARLAGGGMGEVFRATHVELGRPLAVKVMRPELSRDPDFVERFRREAMTASRLGHPHIVDIIDSGAENGQFYFVMEFLDGRTLSRLLEAGPMPVPQALELVTQVARALDVAHRAGVVHRDLKPDNVIVLERSGQPFVKLVDFGVAKVVTATEKALTSHGVIVGTPTYMSPEQAAGLAVDARADIYMLGLILYELLTGTQPFAGETAALMMAAHISQVAPALPPSFAAPLRTLVQRMLAKRPQDRPQSMAEVLTALEAVPRTAPRRARWVALGAGLAVGLGVVGVALRPEAPVPAAPDAAVEVEAAPVTPSADAAVALPDAGVVVPVRRTPAPRPKPPPPPGPPPLKTLPDGV